MNKVWTVTDDQGVYLYAARTSGGALYAYAQEMGISFYEALSARVRRCEAMDGLPLTIYYALFVGVIGWAENGCICGKTIYADHNGWRAPDCYIYTMKDNEARSVVKPGWDDECYCSWTCAMKAHDWRERNPFRAAQ